MKIPRAHSFIRCCIFYAQCLNVFARVRRAHTQRCQHIHCNSFDWRKKKHIGFAPSLNRWLRSVFTVEIRLHETWKVRIAWHYRSVPPQIRIEHFGGQAFKHIAARHFLCVFSVSSENGNTISWAYVVPGWLSPSLFFSPAPLSLCLRRHSLFLLGHKESSQSTCRDVK